MNSLVDDTNLPMYAVCMKLLNQAIGIKKGHLSEEQIKNIRDYGTLQKPPFDWLKGCLVTLGLGGLASIGYLGYQKSQVKHPQAYEKTKQTNHSTGSST
jgi:hypothetical protein